MGDYVRARLAQEAARLASWRDVCGAYPGGPENYRLIPARCVPTTPAPVRRRTTGARGRAQGVATSNQRTRRRPTNHLPQSTLTAAELRHQRLQLQRRIVQLDAQKQAEDRQRQNNSQQATVTTIAHRLVSDTLYEVVSELPSLFVATAQQFAEPSHIRRTPNVDARFDDITRPFAFGEAFRRTPSIRLAVYEIAISELERNA